MKINICSGYPLDSPKGNTVTALWLQGLLRGLGHDATAMHTDTPPKADAQFSIHAIKTSSASLYFAQQNPASKLFVLLAGTDMHGGIQAAPKLAEQVLSAAERLIAFSPAARLDMEERWRSKTEVIYPSVSIPAIPSVDVPDQPVFTCVGHLRPVKNPHLMFRALQEITTPCHAISIGRSLEEAQVTQATKNMAADSRFQWLSDCDRPTALAWMQNSVATINSSISEGGANTVCEAIQLGVPVLASDISGNRGLLGDDYDGYFESGDHQQLANQMQRCLTDPTYRQRLVSQVIARQPLFSREQQLEQLKQLL